MKYVVGFMRRYSDLLVAAGIFLAGFATGLLL